MSKERARARRDQLAKVRAEQKRRDRRRAIVMWSAGGGVALLVAGSAGWYLVDRNARANLDAVASFKYQGSQHTAVQVDYKEQPPVGGPHHSVWQKCGFYDKPVNNEHAVHSMEHGAVWLTYRPDLPKAQVDQIRDMAADDYILASPYAGLPAPVVASSWNNQLRLTGVDDPRLPRFVTRYKNGPGTPELGALCDGTNSTSATADQAPLPSAPPSGAPQSGAPESGAPDAGAPESGAPDAGAPEADPSPSPAAQT